MATSRSVTSQSLRSLGAPDEVESRLRSDALDLVTPTEQTRSLFRAFAPRALLVLIFGAAAYLVWVLAVIAAQGSPLRWVGIAGLVAVTVTTVHFVAAQLLGRAEPGSEESESAD